MNFDGLGSKKKNIFWMALNEVLSASSHTNFMRQGLEVPKNMHGRLDFIKVLLLFPIQKCLWKLIHIRANHSWCDVLIFMLFHFHKTLNFLRSSILLWIIQKYFQARRPLAGQAEVLKTFNIASFRIGVPSILFI